MFVWSRPVGRLQATQQFHSDSVSTDKNTLTELSVINRQ